jgi:hypothetical protein
MPYQRIEFTFGPFGPGDLPSEGFGAVSGREKNARNSPLARRKQL